VNARIELAWEIFRADNSNVSEEELRGDFAGRNEYCIHIADALIAAGYRKQES